MGTPQPAKTVRKYQRKPPYPAFEDPTLPCFLLACFVCKEEAKKGDQHTSHYGGVVCLSCRAFFRRSHQNTRTPTFKCKKKEMCLITTANRRRCQRCRYNRCLKAGMKPDSVLTDDQKKIRFRKINLKKSMTKLGDNCSTHLFKEDYNDESEEDNCSPSFDTKGQDVSNDLAKLEQQDIKPEPEMLQVKIKWSQSRKPDYTEPRAKVNKRLSTNSSKGETTVWKIPHRSNPLPQQSRSQYFNGPTEYPKDFTNNYHGFQQSSYNTNLNEDEKGFTPPPTWPTTIPAPRAMGESQHTKTSTAEGESQNYRYTLSQNSLLSRRHPDDMNGYHAGPKQIDSGPLVADRHHILDFSARNINNCSNGFFTLPTEQNLHPGGEIFGPYSKIFHNQTLDWKAQFHFDQNPHNQHQTENKSFPVNINLLNRDGSQISSINQVDSRHQPESHHSPLFVVPQLPKKRKCSTDDQNSFPQPKVPRVTAYQMQPPESLELDLQDINPTLQLTNEDIIVNEGVIEDIINCLKDDADNGTEIQEIQRDIGQCEKHDIDIYEENISDSKLDCILQSHCLAIRQMMTPSVANIVKKLGTIHCGETSAMKNITRAEFITHLVNMSERFRHFALQQKDFCLLSKTDQRQLIARNSPLYIQMYMGCFFGAANGTQQKDLIKQYQIITKNKTSFNDKYINIHQFNSITRLFRGDCDLAGYIRQIDLFKSLQLTSIEARSILAYMILFDFDTSLNLSDPEKLEKIKLENESMYQRYLFKRCRITRVDFMKTLVKMAVFGSYNIQWDDIIVPQMATNLSNLNLVMAYTQEEEEWCFKQLQTFDEGFLSVPMGEDIIREAVMNALGVPVSKSFMKKTISVFIERFWHILCLSPVLTNLSTRQKEHLRSNIFNGVALLLARLEHCGNGLDQVEILCGQFDLKEFWNTYCPLLKKKDFREVRKLSLKSAVSTESVRCTPSDLLEYDSIVKSLDSVVKNTTVYKLVVLLLLTEPEEFDRSASPISSLHWHYKTLLKRKLEWTMQWFMSFDSIMKLLKELTKMRPIIEKLMQNQ